MKLLIFIIGVFLLLFIILTELIVLISKLYDKYDDKKFEKGINIYE